jgi:hypothetical protein
MSRPQTLKEATVVAVAGHKTFGNAIDEFIDEFYLDHPNKKMQQRRIDDAPDVTGDPLQDAWLGAVGEHLARRWDLDVPAWTRRPEHFALDRPKFIPDSRALHPILLAESPAAFRSRMLFTFAEPLQRARFPGDLKCDNMTPHSRTEP